MSTTRYIDYPKDRDLLKYNLALICSHKDRIKGSAIAQLNIFEIKPANKLLYEVRLKEIINELEIENKKIFDSAANQCIKRGLLNRKRVLNDWKNRSK